MIEIWMQKFSVSNWKKPYSLRANLDKVNKSWDKTLKIILNQDLFQRLFSKVESEFLK